MLNRSQIGRVYRPQGPKVLAEGLAWSSGGRQVVSGAQVDLSTPLEGFRIVLRFRDVVAGANMTSANVLGYLNMISRIFITGKNSRQGGNATLWDVDLPSLTLFQCSLTGIKKPFMYNGVSAVGAASAGTELAYEQPSTPVANFYNGTTGTYDIRIAIDLPAYPFNCAEYLRPGYYIRSQEWADSLQVRLEFPTITNGATHALGTDNAATTHTFTAFGSGAGNGTVDLIGLPCIMGTDLDAQMVPGFLSRVTVPVTATLQAAGGVNTRLLTLEKQNTTRIITIIGVSTVNPHFSSLSDTNLTTLGMVVGGNRVVRENDSIHFHKMEQVRRYNSQPIQGVVPIDFVQSKNPDSEYDAADAGDGTTLELRGTVAGVANALGIFIQETENFRPTGGLYAA